jgi:hypothetical protein
MLASKVDEADMPGMQVTHGGDEGNGRFSCQALM